MIKCDDFEDFYIAYTQYVCWKIIALQCIPVDTIVKCYQKSCFLGYIDNNQTETLATHCDKWFSYICFKIVLNFHHQHTAF